ncbi:MAG: proprotein convertase P-domain-containing protein, partial [Anaerolineae bacterium]|nr:proprotein convertase P-domain-containing protein [Anaerolineae bacterium]
DLAFTQNLREVTGATSPYTLGEPALAPDTVYYWRVRADNLCGVTDSAVSAFRTAAVTCGTYTSLDIPKTIKARPAPGDITSNLAVLLAGSIIDVDVLGLRGTHTWINDLSFRVRSPAGTEVTIMNRSCSNEDNFDLNLDDEAAPGSWPCPPVGGGTYQPSNSLAGFDGQGSSGTWQMIVNDSVNGDGGSLDAWGLRICVGSETVPADYSDLAGSYGVAWHTGDGALRLGNNWTADTTFAFGDDDADDEGITLDANARWEPGATVTIYAQVTGGSGYLAGWFDWNDDGDLADASEKTIGQNVSAGSNTISFVIPTDAGYVQDREVNARFRLYASEPGVLGSETPDGGTNAGEVEDSRLNPPSPTAVTLARFEASPAVEGIHLEWETATEIDHLGFNLYRGAAADGPYDRLNDQLIPSQAPGSPAGAVYFWIDAQVTPGQVYYYQLEAVDVQGRATPYGRVSATAAHVVYLPVVAK